LRFLLSSSMGFPIEGVHSSAFTCTLTRLYILFYSLFSMAASTSLVRLICCFAARIPRDAVLRIPRVSVEALSGLTAPFPHPQPNATDAHLNKVLSEDGHTAEFVCPICQLLVEYPVITKPCDHVFCQRCLEVNSHRSAAAS